MKKIVEYLGRAYNVLADLLAQLPPETNPIPLIGLVTILLLIPILLKILGM